MTEPNEDDIAPEKTRADLEWPRVLGALAARCETAVGKDLASELGPERESSAALRAIAEVAEAMRTAELGEPLPMPSLPDTRDAYARALHGGVLSAVELRAVAEVLGAARTLRRFLHARREALPALFTSCSTDPMLDRVEDHIASSFDADGTLADRASPRLRELRSEYQASRARMITRIEDLMRRYSTILQDGYWTEREGRYVLPVRSDAHERFPGIVHASSGSGATLFVEPRVLIPLGNRLKMLEGEVRREEEAIYAALTARLVEVLGSVQAAITAMGVADLRSAAARLARDLDLRFPEVVDRNGTFVAQLRALRHPLLVLESLETKSEVVPSDIAIEGGHAVVVSGPNAGGKTVALKALGLSALMLRSGLPVAVGDGSQLGLVETVLTDVGDDQSLQKSLSTFSAHVSNLARILDAARPGALVLLDELAGGTDPREGEALAAAVLDGLCRRGAAVVATTHYEGLKALALGDARFQNASVGFDEATLSPTFKLALGIPGASSALSVAKRFGIPSLVIERAETYLSGEERTFEQTVRALNDERRALEIARSAAEAEAIAARGLRERMEQELAELRARDRRVLHHEAEAVFSAVRRAREDVRAAQTKLRTRRNDPVAVREADRLLDGVAAQFAIGGQLAPALDRPGTNDERGERVLDDTKLRKGAKVYVPRLRAEAEVVDVQGDGQLRVSAGSLKITVARSEVRVLVDGPKADGTRGARAPKLRTVGRPRALPDAPDDDLPQFEGADSLMAASPPPLEMQTSDNTCDVRGLRVDDAWPMLESFLDRCLNDDRRVAFVVHGHGTGALRESLRESLKKSRYVSSFRPGNPREGGDGVTVVFLR